ncbi:MAG TPA: hypothetical protein PLB66_07485, partial [Bacteroidales bacterium]|nr:hypothetical protein [Bacteroidales bacterium]
CVIFNDGTHDYVTGKDVRDEHQLILKHNEKMLFGKDKTKGIKLGMHGLEVIEIGKNALLMTCSCMICIEKMKAFT